VRVNDAITGLILLIIAIAVFAYSTTFPQLTGMQFSAGFWPQTICVCLALCGVSLIFSGIKERAGGQAWVLLDEWWRQSGTVFTVFLVPGAILFYILLSDFLGFIITGLIILLVLGLRFGLKPLHAVLLAVATTLGMHFVFVDFLLVQLPWGLLETVVFGS
jgi:putative tricarboxylic transport membrane protein